MFTFTVRQLTHMTSGLGRAGQLSDTVMNLPTISKINFVHANEKTDKLNYAKEIGLRLLKHVFVKVILRRMKIIIRTTLMIMIARIVRRMVPPVEDGDAQLMDLLIFVGVDLILA